MNIIDNWFHYLNIKKKIEDELKKNQNHKKRKTKKIKKKFKLKY